ncbi:uncharacterized protein [Montipora foliosa]|uniref:uncharacterized protein isoform X1 n=3 Tax=Montipora foliosa TaxID=591990 RepID=UPI0035F1AC9A
MNYLLVLCLVVMFFMVKICGSTSSKECRFPLLSNYDDMIANVTADTVDDAASVTPKLYEGWCRRDNEGSAVQVYFAVEVAINGMVIRGHSNRWVEKFSLQYSNDGSTWVYYNEVGEESEPMYLTGNTDAETNNLFWFKFTVTAQYLRIIPYPYEGGTHGGGGKPCFRFELFGCDNDLWNSIGLTEGKIGATLLITSGYARQRFRWNITSIYKGTDSANGWCPLKNDQTNKEPLIILLEAVHLITGFAILKCSSLTCVPEIVTFTMRTWSKRDIEDRPSQQAVSKDGDTAFQLQEAIEGENKSAFLYVFKKAVSGTVIFMNFYSKRCINVDYSFCIQLELYGKQLECLSALGVESSYLHPNGAIKNTQMTASSSHPDHPAYFGRREHFSAWCANPVMLKDPVVARSQYLQIDFIKLKNISAISTQGLDADNYVKAYHVYYAVDGVDFRSLRHEERNVKELLETCPDFGKRQQFNYLSKTILARYLRINPQRWLNNMCMRLEVFGCDVGASPLGMQFGMIPNEQIKASSEIKANPKNFGRLNNAGWCANVEAEALNDTAKTQYHYLQVDLLQPNVICGVATQGIRANEGNQQPEAVTSFYLRYSLTGVEWLRHHRLLTGEYHGNEVVYHWLDPPLVTRFIQFNPQSSRSPLHVCMRAEIYSCSRDERSDYLPLGMESLRISDLQLSASSQSDSSTSAKYSRLNHYIQGGAWTPAESNPTEYLQIDLAWITILTGIATQGHPEKPHRVLTYRLRHRISPDESFVEYNKNTAVIA